MQSFLLEIPNQPGNGSASYTALSTPTFNHKWSMQSASWMLMPGNEPLIDGACSESWPQQERKYPFQAPFCVCASCTNETPGQWFFLSYDADNIDSSCSATFQLPPSLCFPVVLLLAWLSQDYHQQGSRLWHYTGEQTIKLISICSPLFYLSFYLSPSSCSLPQSLFLFWLHNGRSTAFVP